MVWMITIPAGILTCHSGSSKRSISNGFLLKYDERVKRSFGYFDVLPGMSYFIQDMKLDGLFTKGMMGSFWAHDTGLTGLRAKRLATGSSGTTCSYL